MTGLLNALQQIDASALLAVNGAHCPYADSLMWLISGKLAWLPMIAALLWVLWRRGWRQMLLAVLALALAIALADQVSSSLIKPLVQRLRPTRNPDLMQLVHIVHDYRGGMYGFVSSHAANAFASALLLAMVVRGRHTAAALAGWAAVVSYSRVYEGVHYPGDVVCGAVVGVAAAMLAAWAYRHACRKWLAGRETAVPPADAKVLTISVIANLLILAVIAIFN